MTLAERIAGQERRAARMRETYVSAVGTVSTFAPPIPPISAWVQLAQAGRLPAKEYGR